MVYRAAFYLLILIVASLGTIGLGAWNPDDTQSNLRAVAVIAAPFAGNDNDNDNSDADSDNAVDNDNGSTGFSSTRDCDDSGNGDNGDNGDACDNSGDNGGDNGDNGADNGGGDNGDGDNGGGTTRVEVRAAPPAAPPPPPATPRPAATAVPTPTPPPVAVRAVGVPCFFQLGFLTLRNRIPQTVGECLENEQHNPENGDALQLTTGGLLVWRKQDNWTAFTDGATTWINGPCGLQTRPNTSPPLPWEGSSSTVCVR